MITNVTKVWEAAASVAFQGTKCAAGSLPMRKEEVERTIKTSDRVEKRERSDSRPERRDSDVLWEARYGRKVII